MKTELTIPDHFPALKEEDLKARTKRREEYAINRDIQAAAFNKSIKIRLEKDSEKQESDLNL